jgi:hypothetical protein
VAANVGALSGTAQSQAGAQASLVQQTALQQQQIAQQQRDATLGFIGQRQTNLQNQFNANQANANQATQQNSALANSQAQLSLGDIDTALTGAVGNLNHSATDVTNQQAQQQIALQDQLRSNFAGRGAIDSSYYGNALAKGLADLTSQGNDQMFQIHQGITNAQNQALQQKSAIQQALQEQLTGLQQKKNDYMSQLQKDYEDGNISLEQAKVQANQDLSKFASQSELDKIGKLQQIHFSLDNYIQGLQNKAATAKASLGSIGGFTPAQIHSDIASRLGLGQTPAQIGVTYHQNGIIPYDQAAAAAQAVQDNQKKQSALAGILNSIPQSSGDPSQNFGNVAP